MSLNAELDPAEFRLTDEDTGLLESLIAAVNGAAAVTPDMVHVCEKIAYTWPPQCRFPGLDLLRVCSLRSDLVFAKGDDFLSLLVDKAGFPIDDDRSSWTKPQETNAMLGLRLLANVLSTESGITMFGSRSVSIFSAVKRVWHNAASPNLRNAFVSVVYNITCFGPLDEGLAIELGLEIMELLKRETDEETIFRGLVVTGKLTQQSSSVKEFVRESRKVVEGLVRNQRADRVKKVGNEVLSLL